MKKILFLTIILASFILNGCLTYESYESRVMMPKEGNPGTVEMTYYNIASSDTSDKKVSKDFNELIEFYNGDEFLLERLDEGVYLKSRELTVENNKIIGRYGGIFQNLAQLGGISEDEKQIMFKIDHEYELIETNGETAKIGDQSYIVWKQGSDELYWKLRNKGFTTESRTNLAPMLKKYISEHPNQFK